MANNYATKGLTGKSGRKMRPPVSTSLVAAVVDQIPGIANKGHVINDATKSGKQLGAFVICNKTGGKMAPALAMSGQEDGAWRTLANSAVTEITPA